MSGYRNPHHQEAFARAQAAARGMTLDELQNSQTIEKIALMIRVVSYMYHQKALCRRMAEKAVCLEIEQRNHAG